MIGRKYHCRLPLFPGLLLLLTLAACRADELPAPDESATITLRWIKAYAEEDRQRMETGLQWALSFLGAGLPPESWSQALHYRDSSTFELDIRQVGFSANAQRALRVIIGRLKDSEEYRAQGGIDVGRFLMLTLNTSWHYYEITGAAPTYSKFLERHNFREQYAFAVVHSSISRHQRVLRFQLPPSVLDQAFVAEETSGEAHLPDYPIDNYEVMDLMPNGQLRFAIYDASGRLSPGVPVSTSAAGKPAKCLWCHETVVQPLHRATPEVPGYISVPRFTQLVDSINQRLTGYRAGLITELRFDRRPEHTLAELLYISFMEPSLDRTAREWQMEVQQAETHLLGLPVHRHAEFPFLGVLYDRNDVDRLAPYGVLAVPNSAREPEEAEPNFFH